ncbi:hypothetical protein ACIRPX_36630 [Streptomyces sp. NPDC101225]|uniref:hypothetical protein n=1 Tax=Streptomyces sp. NPDC101225 TaxID=3366135 RepID=UPI0037F167F3
MRSLSPSARRRPSSHGPWTPTARKLTTVLRAAAQHRGTAPVEIHHHCPVFNDIAFDTLKDPQERLHRTVPLLHVQTMRFGPEGDYGVVRAPATGGLRVAQVAATGEDALIVHDVTA